MSIRPCQPGLWLGYACCAALLFGTGPVRADLVDDFLFSDHAILARGTSSRLPGPPTAAWIDEAELRVSPEVDAADRRTETYALRFRPVGRKERHVVRELYDIEQALTRTEWSQSLGGVLANRYHEVIDLAEQEVRLALSRRQLVLDRSLLAAEQTLAVSSSFNAARLQEAALRLELAEQEVEEASRKTLELRGATLQDYLRVTEEVLPGVSSRLATPAAIGAALDSIEASLSSTSFDSTLAELELRQAESEVVLDQRRSSFGLNFMEVSYENKLVTSYNLKFGVRLPIGRRTQTSQSRIREVIAAKRRASLTQLLVEEAVQTSIREIRWQIDAHRASEEGLQRLAVRLQGTSADVAALAVLRRHQLDLLQARCNAHIGVLHDFVELLDLAARLQQQPLTNWIQGNTL